MDPKPARILEDLNSKKIRRETALQLLISLVENGKNITTRKKSIIHLAEIGENSDFIFEFLENLLITDAQSEIRALAARKIGNKYFRKAFNPLIWAFNHEFNYECLMEIIDALVKINEPKVKKFFWNNIQERAEQNYIDKKHNYSNKEFRNSIQQLFHDKGYEYFHLEYLAEILINFLTIQRLIEKFYTVFFEWEDGVVKKLDLSEIGWNVNVWRQNYSERIKSFSEIEEIKRLKHLKVLDLNSNRLSNIKKIENLESLTHLYLANNRLKEKKNIDYLKKLPNLIFLDIAGNKIADLIQKDEMGDVYVVRRHGFGERLNQFSILYGL
ncbi:MAG: hypothetical protein ACOC4M_00845 [Promethearchaeia archaeon]